MEDMVMLLATVLVGTIGMCILFGLVATFAHKVGRKSKAAYAVIIPFVILDLIYNWTLGTVLCLQPPKEWDELATKRMKRYKREYDMWDTGIKGWRLRVANTVCKFLSKFDPEHC